MIVRLLALTVGCVLVASCGQGRDEDGQTGQAPSSSSVDSLSAEELGAGARLVLEEDRSAEAEVERVLSDVEVFDQREQYVAGCMERAGFEFIPGEAMELFDDLAPDIAAFGPPSSEDEAAADEYAATYGFGLTTQLTEMSGATSESVADRNGRIVESLSAEERQAYLDERSTCDQEAEERYPMPDRQIDPKAQAAEAEATALTNADPRVAEVDDAWRRCMREQGFDFGDQNEAMQSITSLAQGLLSEVVEFNGSVFHTELSEAELSSQLGSADYERLNELRAYEIQVAVASRQCTGDMADVWFTVFQEHLRELAEG